MDKEYKKSLNRCPICGTLVGCVEVGGYLVCSTEEFQSHVSTCRETNRVKQGKVRFEGEE